MRKILQQGPTSPLAVLGIGLIIVVSIGIIAVVNRRTSPSTVSPTGLVRLESESIVVVPASTAESQSASSIETGAASSAALESIRSPSTRAPSPLAEIGAPVASENNPSPPALTGAALSCTGDTWEILRCYGAYFEDLVRTSDPLAAMMQLKERYATDGFIKAQCHQLAHVIGRGAAAKYPSVAEAYVRGDPACWSGYYHGVMEGVLSTVTGGEKALSAATLNSLCTDIRTGPTDYSFDYFNCVHGVGHGVMYIRDNELFESLDLCALFEGAWEQSSCAGGAFMENVIADEKNHFAKYLKSDDLFYPCNASPEQFKRDCYLMQTSYMLKQVGGDFGRVFTLCSQVEAPYVDTCYESLGRDASGWSISNVESTKGSCLLGSDFRQQSHCILGAVRDFVSYHHSDVQAKALCAALPQELQSVCFNEVSIYYAGF